MTDWRTSLDPTVWTRLTVRDGEKGPVHIEMIKRRVQTRMERKRLGPEEWLVVTRRPLSDDRPLEPHASRDATDQDTRYRYHSYLTPTCPKLPQQCRSCPFQINGLEEILSSFTAYTLTY